MTQSDLKNIAENDLINYTSQGGTAPSAAYLKDLQRRWKTFAEHKNFPSV